MIDGRRHGSPLFMSPIAGVEQLPRKTAEDKQNELIAEETPRWRPELRPAQLAAIQRWLDRLVEEDECEGAEGTLAVPLSERPGALPPAGPEIVIGEPVVVIGEPVIAIGEPAVPSQQATTVRKGIRSNSLATARRVGAAVWGALCRCALCGCCRGRDRSRVQVLVKGGPPGRDVARNGRTGDLLPGKWGRDGSSRSQLSKGSTASVSSLSIGM